MRALFAAAVASLLASSALSSAPAAAVELAPGDILVVDLRDDRLLRVDPETGARTLISAGGLLREVGAVAIAADGRILVGVGLLGTNPGIVAVDAATGAQTLVTTRGLLRAPQDMAVEADGTLAIADAPRLSSDPGRVVRVDPGSGTQTLLATGGGLQFPAAIAPLAGGDLLVFDGGFGGAGPGALLRIDATTGAQTALVDPTIWIGIMLAVDGHDGFYGTIFPGGVIHVDLATGVETPIAELGNVTAGEVDADGSLVLAEEGGGRARISRLDPTTGEVQEIASFFAFVMGLAIVPDPVLEISIDVRPGARVNRVRVGAPTTLFVSLRGSEDFDVRQVDVATLRLGPGGAAARPRALVRDLDGDGFADRVLGFRIDETGLAQGDHELCLSGATLGGQRFEGCDGVVAIGPPAS